MFSTSWEKARAEETVSSPLTPVEKNRIEHEALHIAATKGGLITIRGREMQAKTSFDESRRSAVVEGLLWQISEQVTRKAQVACYRDQGLSKHDIIKAMWHVEEGPLYEQACAEYEEIVSSFRRKG
jgi:hypothetical protein